MALKHISAQRSSCDTLLNVKACVNHAASSQRALIRNLRHIRDTAAALGWCMPSSLPRRFRPGPLKWVPTKQLPSGSMAWVLNRTIRDHCLEYGTNTSTEREIELGIAQMAQSVSVWCCASLEGWRAITRELESMLCKELIREDSEWACFENVDPIKSNRH